MYSKAGARSCGFFLSSQFGAFISISDFCSLLTLQQTARVRTFSWRPFPPIVTETPIDSSPSLSPALTSLDNPSVIIDSSPETSDDRPISLNPVGVSSEQPERIDLQQEAHVTALSMQKTDMINELMSKVSALTKKINDLKQ